jgi:prepilin-type N-terminal cleavage/methylation domain-containing protein
VKIMTRKRDSSEGGFSLVEPLIAMAILSISLLGAVGMFVIAQDGISGGAKSLEASALAESKLERLRAAPYQALLYADLNGDGHADAQDSGTDGDTAAGDGEYTGHEVVNGIVVMWTVRPDQPSLAFSQMTMITVTAQWVSRTGQPRKVRLGMRRANPVFSGGAA